jgi:hypothetical protein
MDPEQLVDLARQLGLEITLTEAHGKPNAVIGAILQKLIGGQQAIEQIGARGAVATEQLGVKGTQRLGEIEAKGALSEALTKLKGSQEIARIGARDVATQGQIGARAEVDPRLVGTFEQRRGARTETSTTRQIRNILGINIPRKLTKPREREAFKNKISRVREIATSPRAKLAIAEAEAKISEAEDKVARGLVRKIRNEATTLAKADKITAAIPEPDFATVKSAVATGRGVTGIIQEQAKSLVEQVRPTAPADSFFRAAGKLRPLRVGGAAGLGAAGLLAAISSIGGQKEPEGLPPFLQAQLAIEQIRAQGGQGQQTSRQLVDLARFARLLKTIQEMQGVAAAPGPQLI